MANLASLVVSLEANMAKFQTDMQRSAAVTEQSMAKMALSSEQAKNAVNRLESQFNKAGSAAISMGKSMLLGAAVGLSFDALASKISGVIESMANLKTMSEKTGSSVENLSKLGFVAKQSGSDMDSVSTALTKLAKNMAGADADTKGAGLAFSYLGLKAKDAAGNLKDPAAMFTEIAKKLNTYQDGAGKAAIAQAIFGKAGAEMLPTLKLLGEQGDIAAKVMDDQSTAARQYMRDIAKLDVQKNALFKTIALALLPTMTDFSNVLLDASKDTNVLNKAAKDLASDHSIEDWADAGAMVLAGLIDTIKVLPSLFSIASSAISDLAARTRTASLVFLGTSAEYTASVRAQGATQMELSDKIGAYMSKEVNSTQNAMRLKIDARNADRENMLKNGASIAAAATAAAAATEKAKPNLAWNPAGEGKAKRGGGGNGPKDDPAKKLLDGNLKEQEAFIAAEKTQLSTREQYLQYYYTQEYTNAADYYGTKNQLIQDALKSQLEAYDKEAAAVVIYQAKADTLTKQQEARNMLAEIAKKRTSAEIESNKKLTDSVMEQDAIYNQFRLTTEAVARSAELNNAQAQFQIDLLGKGTLEVAKLTEARRIDLALEQKIYDNRLKVIPESDIAAAAAQSLMQKNAAMGVVEDSYNRQRTAIFGATEAMRKYAESTGNQAAQVEGAMTNAFTKAEDAFVEFTTTGKLNFKGLAESIIGDLIRIQARASMQSMLGGGGGGGLAGIIGGLFSGGTKGNNPSAFVSGGGFMDSIGSFFSGLKFADGGSPPMGMASMVGERGPEMFVPNQAGTIIPNHKLGGGGESITIINQTTGRIDNVVSQSISPGERQLIIQETREAVAADHYDPNSRVSRAMKNNYTAARVR